MAEKRYIHIRNWDNHQHRDVTRNKHSAAPWIMDWRSQLDDEEWMELGYADRGLLQSLRLQYAANRGRGINESTTNLQRLLGHRVLRVQLERLNHAGFIEFSASKLPQKARLDVDVDVDTPLPPTRLEVEEVFREWARVTDHERCKLTGDRERKIRARLAEGYTVEQLKLVAHGSLKDKWEERPKFNDVGVLYRNSQQVDKFLELAGESNGSVSARTASELAQQFRL